MSRIFYILLVVLFAFTLNKTLKKGDFDCLGFGDDCDFSGFRRCCEDFVCKDYRCALKETKENQVGRKCDWFHHCQKGYKCESHRCIKICDLFHHCQNGYKCESHRCIKI